jgi:aspartate/methionine/tyrosine aminotransferase
MLPVSFDIYQRAKHRLGIEKLSSTTIHRVCALAAALEAECGEQFVHLELSNPAMPPSTVGVNAECIALRRGVAGVYPCVDGLLQLKKASARFFRLFLNINVPAYCHIPVAGTTQGSFALLSFIKQSANDRDTIIFICPGYTTQIEQARILGFKTEFVDMFDYRSKKLGDRLTKIFEKDKVAAVLYSVPSNPAWTTLTEEELEIIGKIATEHEVIVIEDQACCGLDFREDYSVPGKPPYVPTVARYTDHFALLLSASKIFNYSGQRIAMACISQKLYDTKDKTLQKIYDLPTWGEAFTRGYLFNCLSAPAHSAQHAFAAMLNAACDASLDFVDDAREYELRSALAKQMFCDNGFHILYKNDIDRKISNGIYFTVGYEDMHVEVLQSKLMQFGIVTNSLLPTGSRKHGVSVSVAALGQPDWFAMLELRLQAFNNSLSKS